MSKPIPTNPWHRKVLSAYLRRSLSFYRADQWGRTLQEEHPDYHPVKAILIYRRFCKIIDLYF